VTTYIATYRHHCETSKRPAPHALTVEARTEHAAELAAHAAVDKRHGSGVYLVEDVVPAPMVGDRVEWVACDPWGARHALTGKLVRIWPEEPAAGGGRFRHVTVAVDLDTVPETMREWYDLTAFVDMAQATARPAARVPA
jgi:hypothetical protein